MPKIKLVVAGAAGRMGTAIIKLAGLDPELEIVGRLESQDKQSADPSLSGDISQVEKADAVINFATPEGTAVGLFPAMEKYATPWVIGTTGFNAEQEAKIQSMAQKMAIVKSSNMSLGVNVFFKVAQQIAKVLPNYQVNIWEAHHKHKKDAPSGTALQAGKLIEEITGVKVTYDNPKREGEIVGDHRIIFSSPEEKFEIYHHAKTRDIFALGALRAAKWLATQKPAPGLYTMQDVLGLK